MFDPDWLTTEDTEMAIAMRNARASFWEFARNVELEQWRIIPAHDAAVIKAFFPDSPQSQNGEFLFVDELVITRTTIQGTLVSQPSFLEDLSPGDAVAVPVENVCDWILVIRDKGIGGFTVDVLKNTIPLDELDEYESRPPVSWYRHRKNSTAQTELEQVPVCKQCGQRDLFDLSYRNGLCGCCVNGLKRTECPQCGVPLIRSPEASPECRTCSTR